VTDLRFSSVSGKVREIAKTLRPCPTFEPAADSRDLHDLHDLHVLTYRSKWAGRGCLHKVCREIYGMNSSNTE
jgi:hypothetical protein